jgi:hypothetical protein
MRPSDHDPFVPTSSRAVPVLGVPRRRVVPGALSALLLLLAFWTPAPTARSLAGQPAAGDAAGPAALGSLERVSSGVHLARLSDPTLLDPEGPVEVLALRIDPGQAHLEIALADDRTPALEPVAVMAAREGAVAAVNGGFFGPGGSPQGVLRVRGHWLGVSASRARGAVAILEEGGRTRLLFDRIRVGLVVEATRKGGRRETIPVAHVNPPGTPPGLSVYTPPYVDPRTLPPAPDGEKAEPAPTAVRGLTILCTGQPCRILRQRSGTPRVTVPPQGLALVYRGARVPAALDRLARGDRLALREQVETLHGTTPRAWSTAPDILGGAGLLIAGGAMVDDWEVERVRDDFVTTRHPRTLVGADRDGFIWLVVVDGRRPDSLGMRLDELQRLAGRLGLVDALNLDGGGSTTLVVENTVVNRPSDPIGPRKVSDSLLVLVP